MAISILASLAPGSGVTRVASAHSTSAITMGPFILTQRTRSRTCWAPLCTVLWTFFWVIIGIRLSLARGVSEDKGQPTSKAPLWQLDVRALGYVHWAGPWEKIGRGGMDQICFPTSSQVAITYVTREAPGALPRRGQSDAALPFRLHALFVDTRSGLITGKREWPTASGQSGIVPAIGGEFIVVTPDKLMLYSSALEILKELELALGREAIDWRVAPSPGGKYLVVEFQPQSDIARGAGYTDFEWRRLWINAENLQVLRTWTERGISSHDWTISDDGLAFDGWKIGRPDGPREWLCLPYNNAKPYCGGYGSLLTNQIVFMMSWPPRDQWMALISTSGEVLMHQDLLHGETFRKLVHSADGRRFALSLDKGKGGSAALDIAPHYSLNRIIVYDLAAREWIYTLDPKKQKIKAIHELALSPDGNL